VKELELNAPAVPIILVGNKCDLRKTKPTEDLVDIKDAEMIQAKNMFFDLLECSAKELLNYKGAFDRAIEAVIKFRQKSMEKRQNKKRKCPFGK
jgi:GTPase SAR1 family protein